MPAASTRHHTAYRNSRRGSQPSRRNARRSRTRPSPRNARRSRARAAAAPGSPSRGARARAARRARAPPAGCPRASPALGPQLALELVDPLLERARRGLRLRPRRSPAPAGDRDHLRRVAHAPSRSRRPRPAGSSAGAWRARDSDRPGTPRAPRGSIARLEAQLALAPSRRRPRTGSARSRGSRRALRPHPRAHEQLRQRRRRAGAARARDLVGQVQRGQQRDRRPRHDVDDAAPARARAPLERVERVVGVQQLQQRVVAEQHRHHALARGGACRRCGRPGPSSGAKRSTRHAACRDSGARRRARAAPPPPCRAPSRGATSGPAASPR